MLVPAPAAAQRPDLEATVHGLILMNAFHTSNKTNNSDLPQFALPPDPADIRRRAPRAAPSGSRG